MIKVVEGSGQVHRFYREDYGDQPVEFFGHSGTLTQNADRTYTYVGLDDATRTFGIDGRVTSYVNRDGSIQLQYDHQPDATVISDQYGGSWTYHFVDDRVTSVVFDGSTVVTYAYDASDRLISASYPQRVLLELITTKTRRFPTH